MGQSVAVRVSNNVASGYAFGDTEIARRRLTLLAETFERSSEQFLRESVNAHPDLAADLGCGPGYSTHLLAKVANPRHTIGFDNSQRFLAHALTAASKSVTFERHDITRAQFPRGPFDLMFSRFALTHLRDPEGVVAMWCSQLRPAGRLLIEEVEHIETLIPAFVAYLGIQRDMLANQDNSLYVGPRFGAMADPERSWFLVNQVTTFDVSPARAAGMFHMNLATVRNNDFVREKFDSKFLAELDEDLHAMTRIRASRPSINWQLRQIVLGRYGP